MHRPRVHCNLSRSATLGCRRGHPLWDLFNRYMLLAVQAGLVEHWENEARLQYHVEQDAARDAESVKAKSDGQKTRRLHLHNIDFVFVALFTGCAFATACFGLECLTVCLQLQTCRKPRPAARFPPAENHEFCL